MYFWLSNHQMETFTHAPLGKETLAEGTLITFTLEEIVSVSPGEDLIYIRADIGDPVPCLLSSVRLNVHITDADAMRELSEEALNALAREVYDAELYDVYRAEMDAELNDIAMQFMKGEE